MTKVRFVSKEITVANGVAAAQQPDSFIELPKDYQKVTGIAAVEVTSGGISRDYELGLEEAEGETTIDQVNAAVFGVISPNTDVDPVNRFRDDVQFAIQPKRTKIKLKTNSNTTSTLKLQIVFRCERYDNC